MEKPLLHKYFSGLASVEEEKKIMDWAEASAENYETYLKERKWWDAIVVNANLLAINRKVTRKRTSRIYVWKISTAVASLAFLLVLSYVFYSTGVQNEGWQTVTVPSGQRTQIVLDDGTVVWLNSLSTLTFPTSFNATERIVQLNGEGFFEVEKDEKKPFIVQTNLYDIRVLGTSFNVLSYEKRPVFQTDLLSGEVLITSRADNKRIIKLKARENVVIMDGKLRKGMVGNYDYFRWREGLICLDDERFEDLISKFSHYFDIDIKIENPVLNEYHCTGKFRRSDGVEYALKVLQEDLRFTYERNNELNRIIIR